MSESAATTQITAANAGWRCQFRLRGRRHWSGEAAPHAIQILRAKPDDSATLTEIAFAAKRHWGYPERWIANWTHLLTVEPRSIAEQETYAAHVEGEPVGFYSLSRGADGMRLEHLWVRPRSMRRGVGRALFLHAVGRVRALGFARFEIESDPNAAAFYEHLGARRIAMTITELEGRPRELPVLVYELEHAARA